VNKRASEASLRAMFAMLDELGISDRQQRLRYIADAIADAGISRRAS
jgi:hypothetical protein